METKGSLGAAFFSANRKRLREVFGGTAPIVIAGNSLLQKSADQTFPLAQDSNFWYLTGLDVAGVVLVFDKTEEYLILPARTPIHDMFDGPLDEEQIMQTSGIHKLYTHDEGWGRLEKRIDKAKHVATLEPAPVYIEHYEMFSNPSRRRLIKRIKKVNPNISLIDLRSYMTNLRMVKRPEELQNIQSAIKVTSELLKNAEKWRKKVTYEYELLAEMRYFLAKKQLDFAFDPVVSAGKKTAILHNADTTARISPDELLLIDVGVRFNGYCSDITRTIIESPSKRHLAVYEAVLSVHEFATSLLKPGTNLRTYEEAVVQFLGEKLRELGLIKTINKEAVREFYPQLTSHHIGLDPHDTGDFDTPLKPGMVLAVEPAIYISDEGIGIRLEDMVLITEDGNENLTKHIKKEVYTL